MQASQATIHEFLIEQLSACKRGLVDFAFKHGTVVCLICGWIISSEQAQRFYAASCWIRLFSTIGLVTYAIVYSRWVISHYDRSLSVFKDLETTAYMDPRLFASLRIRRDLAWSFILFHVMLCGGMVLFIWLIPHHESYLLPLKS